MNHLSNIFCKLLDLLKKGLFHIFGASAINKAVAFITNIAIVWFLTKDGYGVFSYANNIYSIAVLASGLGLLNGSLQFCLEEQYLENRIEILRYSLIRGIAVNCGIAIVLMIIGLFIPLSINDAGIYLVMFAPLIILFYVFEFFSTVLRIFFENKKYALCLSINTISYFFFACIGAYIGGIAGTILARYAAYGLSIIIAFFFARKHLTGLIASKSLNNSTISSLWKYSIPTQFSWALNQLTYLLDVFLVGLFLHEATSVATYKVATMLPEGLMFIPSSIIIFAMPYFIKHNTDRDWFIKNSKLFILCSAIAYSIITIALIIFAEPIIALLWGEQYLDATLPFRLLAVSFTFSAIRSACTHLLTAIRAVKANLYISIISLVINIILCLVMIPAFGINGAAIVPTVVSVTIFIVSLIVMINCIKGLRVNNNE